MWVYETETNCNQTLRNDKLYTIKRFLWYIIEEKNNISTECDNEDTNDLDVQMSFYFKRCGQ